MITAIAGSEVFSPDFQLIKTKKFVNPDEIANSLKTEFELPEQKHARERLAQQQAIMERRCQLTRESHLPSKPSCHTPHASAKCCCSSRTTTIEEYISFQPAIPTLTWRASRTVSRVRQLRAMMLSQKKLFSVIGVRCSFYPKQSRQQMKFLSLITQYGELTIQFHKHQ